VAAIAARSVTIQVMYNQQVIIRLPSNPYASFVEGLKNWSLATLHQLYTTFFHPSLCVPR
jgi:hypothetical protein